MTEIISILPSCPAACRDLLPNIPAIYFLMRGDECLYVGKSVSLRDRWVAHEKLEGFESLDGLRVAWKPVAVADLNREEAELINGLRPALNRKTPRIPPMTRYLITPSLEWRLNEILHQKGHSLYWLAREARIPYISIAGLSQPRSSKKLHLPTLAKICTALKCQPGDLLVQVRGETPPEQRKSRKGMNG